MSVDILIQAHCTFKREVCCFFTSHLFDQQRMETDFSVFIRGTQYAHAHFIIRAGQTCLHLIRAWNAGNRIDRFAIPAYMFLIVLWFFLKTILFCKIMKILKIMKSVMRQAQRDAGGGR